MSTTLTFGTWDTTAMPGYWLLAHAGKTVFRPGGRELTNWLLAHTTIRQRRVVEFASGVGLAADLILRKEPASYTAINCDNTSGTKPTHTTTAMSTIPPDGQEEKSFTTSLPSNSADVVIGEAMLFVHHTKEKKAIIEEAFRILAPGGTYSIHELGLRPDTLNNSLQRDICAALTHAIHTDAHPLTINEWSTLLEEAGFTVILTTHNDMHLLEPRRLIADEGFVQALRIMKNVFIVPETRRRIFGMRTVFRTYDKELCAVSIIARKPHDAATP